ncbi:MAG: 5-amino-6-(5-phospho-D-ribitylamino)uracil phosphatase YigB [Paracidovorax wautersii]|uniref:5-amino-6-(5-phospho-D-ribitylamino)uracil phosphatase YigB n=1 Tax=Paracidovorax wautersii TaxID=1177982 RepID=A0A7V8FKP4_9BURK|nr:MAG: 5-amino-6-(5-phospho-D-ribitylamino)uracil phosphatase YigB [Paracidovorax wautersii]
MLDLQKIQGISLDLDDTLWPVWPAIGRAEQVLLQWLQQHAPRTAAAYDSPQALRELRLAVERERPDLHHDLSGLRRESIRLALTRAGDDPALAEPAFTVFFDERQNVELFDDVHEVLGQLAAHLPIVALSNGNANVHRTGIGQYFRGAIHAREFGVGKPDRRIFEAAADALQVPVAAVLHIGDDPLLDVKGAHEAGMQTVWINRTGKAWALDFAPSLEVTALATVVKALAPRLQTLRASLF